MHWMSLCGSLRKESYNRKLLNVATTILKEKKIQTVEFPETVYQIPHINEDLEKQGIPIDVLDLGKLVTEAQAIVIATPEYNHNFPGHLKTFVDWISRIKPAMPWKNKPVVLLSASPSMAGGNQGLWNFRISLENLGAFVYPEMFSLAVAHKAFKEDGTLSDEKTNQRLEALMDGYLKYVKALNPPK